MNFFAYFINSGRCYICDKEEDLLCEKCFFKLEKIQKIEILNNFKLTSFFKYNQTASKILLMAKYPPFYFYILKILIKKIDIPKFSKDTILCPVPLSGLKMFERKFNQAEVISKEIAKIQKIDSLDILKRIKDTKPLFNLNKILRKGEVSNAFRVSFLGKKLPKKETLRVVLVDDLVTTGETVSQCVVALRDAGYKNIEVLSLFRA